MTGIIAPSEDEFLPLLEAMQVADTVVFARLIIHTGTLAGHPVAACWSGVGKVNAAIAAQVLAGTFGVDSIILSGAAAVLVPNLGIGDLVVGQRIAHHDQAAEILVDYHPWLSDSFFTLDPAIAGHCEVLIQSRKNLRIQAPAARLGTIVTGEQFITPLTRQSIIDRFAPDCVDMESASVAQVCHANNIPCLVVRSISDRADHTGARDFEVHVAHCARHAADFILEFLAELPLSVEPDSATPTIPVPAPYKHPTKDHP